VLGALAEGILLSLLIVGLISGTALAGRGHGNKGQQATASGGCVVDGSVVRGSGLPTDEVVNFMITDSAGSRGWVLGFSDGTWDVNVPSRSGRTTYEFISRTWGPSSSPHYTVFASCSAG